MDETIITNWNASINDGDVVYHLGDFAFRNLCDYRNRMKGGIVLIRGNHDYKIKGKEFLFKSIHDLLDIGNFLVILIAL
jgi:calcineurin-like phosphoesterase family protein